MLPVEEVAVFDKGGRVWWCRRVGKLKGDPINAWIGAWLLEEKGGSELRAEIATYAVEWRLANEVDLVLVMVSHKAMEVHYGGELLDRLRSVVLRQARQEHFDSKIVDKAYDAIARDVEAKHLAEKKVVVATGPPPESMVDEDTAETAPKEELSVEEKLRRRGVASKGSTRRKSAPSAKDGATTSKKPTVWRDAPRKRVTAAEVAELDMSKAGPSEEVEEEAHAKAYMPEADETAAWEEEEEEETESRQGWLSSLVDRAAGTATLSREHVEPIMDALRERLVAKNVAQEIAVEICDSVSTSLVGARLERFGRVKTAVTQALEAAVQRVLTPKRSTDVLREAMNTKRKPYVVVFVGINGVGKSTTLSKVAYYLKSHGLDVAIAACDTFRSGAVEQLRSHAKCLGVELFERGYLKEPADVAKAAIEEAAKAKRDCVLVDTAGRMQNNEKLMRELAKLVSVNKPDLVLFVGEALVGSDGVNQITMFNKALMNFANDNRSIDGIILTKFDCIDDKVGAALSVTYKTGQPIVFVGVGQKYIHLKKLSVAHVLNQLFQ